MEFPSLATTYQRNIVLVYKRGPSLTHYLGLEGCTLSAMKMANEQFDREYTHWDKNTVQDFATKYMSSSRSSLIGLTGAAHRVMQSIISNSSSVFDDEFLTNQAKEPKMATEQTFRKPEGAVAQIHAFLDKKLEVIKAGTVSRKELIEQLEAKGLNISTITTQCGVWGRANDVTFPRPTQAAETKAAKTKATRAAKKAA